MSIPQIPNKYLIPELKNPLVALIYTSPELFEEFLSKEKTFWADTFSNVKPARTGPLFLCQQSIDNAINTFKSAINAVPKNLPELQKKQSLNNAKTFLQQAKQHLSNDTYIYSNTILAKELFKYADKSSAFFDGFFGGISRGEVAINNSNNKETILGIYKAFEYIELIRKIDEMLPKVRQDFENVHSYVINTANAYAQKYDELFAEKQTSFSNLDDTIQKDLKERQNEHSDFIKKRGDDLTALEKLYAEKLKLSKPADYWKTMSDDYGKKGKRWLIVTGIIAAITITVLTILIIFAAGFDNDDLINTLKNTAILTVIVATAMFILRLTSKIAMSSYHLSRDAKEREQLSYFYLALINETAVTDKERELIFSALFSRSDTGLLKGDASPELPSIPVVTELVGKK